ncbi:MAG TPA: anion permease [Lentisphaeria bacterium]|nr:MAG: inorganic phosphate transporter [Lentisphaerae bacterium GWF2_38_69]HBM15236.1 anion permease [Lentisphaeria bacterium]
MTLVIVIVLITIALGFEYINGFHDTANAVATSISTKALTPLQAIVIAALFNLIGAFLSTNVAVTIGKGLVDPHAVSGTVIAAALFAAIIWNLITWYLGIPSSSSHALMGGLVGAVWAYSSIHSVFFIGLIKKVILPMLFSPIIAFFLAFIIMIICSRIFYNTRRARKVNNNIREVQVISTALMAASHGSNDAQKSMAIITLTLMSYGYIDNVAVPAWVILICAICMAAGTLSGGMRIIKTLSSRVAQLKPVSGVSAELSSAILIFTASFLGFPLSTTQAVSGSIMGAGSTGKKSINWGVAKSMVIGWGLTIPICMVVGAVIVFFINWVHHITIS